jgi:hypothetical protein
LNVCLNRYVSIENSLKKLILLQIPLSVSGADGFLHFGHQLILSNTWAHSAHCTGEKSELSCCLATGIPHASSTSDGATEVTATGTTLMRPTLRSAFIIRK